MSAKIVSEALLRIEHKLDLLLEKIVTPDTKQVGNSLHICPLCKQLVQYSPDLIESVIARKCGCSSGKIAPIKTEAFTPQEVQNIKRSYYERDRDEEDGIDTDSRRRSRRR